MRFTIKRFRDSLGRRRWTVLAVTALTTFYAADGQLWAQTVQHERAERERIETLAKRLDVSPERLERQSPGLAESLRALLGAEQDDARRADLVRFEARLEQMQREVAANPYRGEIDAVVAASAASRAEAALAKIAELSSLDARRLPRATRRALLRSLRADLDAELVLPERADLPDLPAVARSRAESAQASLDALAARLRPAFEEESARIGERYRAAGLEPPDGRPFRAPPPTTRPSELAGRRNPGEVTLAKGGVLFLDHLTAFGRRSLRALRQPIEGNGRPWDPWGSDPFLLIAVMRPCPCGGREDHRLECTWSPWKLAR